MTPRTAGQRYADMVATGEIHADPAQREVLAYLDGLAKGLRNAQHRPWWKRFFRPPAAVRGLYLWGRVGRGKTHAGQVRRQVIGDPAQRGTMRANAVQNDDKTVGHGVIQSSLGPSGTIPLGFSALIE